MAPRPSRYDISTYSPLIYIDIVLTIGTTGIPLIGRIWDIPRSHSYLRFKKWSDIYGPIYQINVFGVNHVWVATDKIATDLLVKRGSLYSDRPPINNLENSKGAPEYLPLLGHNGEPELSILPSPHKHMY